MNLIRRRLPEIAFAALFFAGLMLGGSAALAGLPKFVEAVVSGMAARADVGETRGVVRLGLSPELLKSVSPQLTPQVLYPVAHGQAPAWPGEAMREANASRPSPRGQRPVIAICIDDLGEDIAATGKAMALRKEVALSFLPFAEATPNLAEAAGRRGHLVLAHVPMQALGGQNPGPMALEAGMAADEIARRLDWSLARVPGLAGINNHEGSRFTQDSESLQPVMAALRARHLFFLDSRTSAGSLAEASARAAGVTTASRDVFIDDDQSPAAISRQLEMLAATATRTGVAIAIGHPHDVTLKLLAQWLAQDHGVRLVSLDDAIRLKNQNLVALAAR